VLLVHPKKDNPDHWEVKWTWMPFFLAADTNLHKEVDHHLTTRFGKADLSHPSLPFEMHQAVIDFVVEKYKFPGLKAYLEGIMAVSAPVETAG
jgi:hypothetical protein